MKKLLKYFLLLQLFIIPLKVNAASGLIDIYTSNKNVIVGNSITVTVYCKSTSAPIGTCEYILTYDSSKLKLTSGDTSVLDYASNNSTYSLKRTYSFKVIGSGTSTIGAKSYAIRDFNTTNEIATSVSGVSIKGMTQSELEATYSTNNNLSKLSIKDYQISPTFNKNTLEYNVTVNSNVEEITINASVEDSNSSLTGTGTFKVSEGENKFNIIVTSQKGTKKTYTLVVKVNDENPINVSINNEAYTIVKRKSSLTMPNSTYTETTVNINDIEIPAFYSEITNYTLVGLKSNTGNISLYIYDKDNNTYTLYQELSFNNLKLNITENYKIPNNTTKKNIIIKEKEVTAYEINPNYYLIYATNIETGKSNWYTYEETEQTVQIYNNTLVDNYEKKLDTAKQMMYYLVGGIVFITLTLIIVACTKSKKNNKKKKQKNKKDFDFGNEETTKQNKIKDDLIKQQMEEKINELDKKKKKDKKKDKTLDLQWTKEVKKVDKKLILEKDKELPNIKEIEKEIKKQEKQADIELKNPNNN